jgi:hypothetical protein
MSLLQHPLLRFSFSHSAICPMDYCVTLLLIALCIGVGLWIGGVVSPLFVAVIQSLLTTSVSDMNQITLLQLHTRSCLIIPSGDHHKPAEDSHPADYGVVKYPSDVMSNYCGPQAPLQAIRQATMQVITNADPGSIQILYHVRLFRFSVLDHTLTCHINRVG